jgi:hypothetical protein
MKGQIMKNKPNWYLTLALGIAALVPGVVSAAPPDGWILAGSKPANYETGTDQLNSYNSRPSAFMKAKTDGEGFGTLMQSFSAEQYRGKRVRLSGWVKSDMVSRWAGLWMRIDGPVQGGTPQILGFDNMQGRPIKGTLAWQKYEVVLDVPQTANGIAFGILQDGPGEVWLNSVEFAVVGTGVAVTGTTPTVLDGPRNLSLEK